MTRVSQGAATWYECQVCHMGYAPALARESEYVCNDMSGCGGNFDSPCSGRLKAVSWLLGAGKVRGDIPKRKWQQLVDLGYAENLPKDKTKRLVDGGFFEGVTDPRRWGMPHVPVVQFYKDGDSMGVRTTASTVDEFMNEASEQLAKFIESGEFAGDWGFQLRFWIPQIVEVACKLKGYKADVTESRVITAGAFDPPESALVRPGDRAELTTVA